MWAIPQQQSATWQKVHSHTSELVFGRVYSSMYVPIRLIQYTLLRLISRKITWNAHTQTAICPCHDIQHKQNVASKPHQLQSKVKYHERQSTYTGGSQFQHGHKGRVYSTEEKQISMGAGRWQSYTHKCIAKPPHRWSGRWAAASHYILSPVIVGHSV